MKYTDYPLLFQASDTASIEQQKYHLRATKSEYYFVLLAAIFSAISFADETCMKLCSAVTAIALMGALISRLLLKILGWEKNWFDTRAIAESIKTMTWRYVMGVGPYTNAAQPEVNDKFIKDVSGILSTLPSVAPLINATAMQLGAKAISPRMKEIRDLSLNERKNIYLSTRVSDQKHWYASKADYNAKHMNTWFFIILISEFIGVLYAGSLIWNPCKVFNPLGIVTTLTAIFCAWTQTKRFQDLSQSYAIAAQELLFIEDLAHDISSEGKLSEYVTETEGAISREHTLWAAKRK